MIVQRLLIILNLALSTSYLSTGEMGKKKNIAAPAEEAQEKLREKRPAPKIFISAEIVDEREQVSNMKKIVVNTDEFSIMGKLSSGWTDLELEKIKSLEIIKQSCGDRSGQTENCYTEEDGNLLLKTRVIDAGSNIANNYLINSKTFLSGRTKKGGMKRGWFIKDLKSITITEVAHSKSKITKTKLDRAINKAENEERKEDSKLEDGWLSSVKNLLGFKKKTVDIEDKDEEPVKRLIKKKQLVREKKEEVEEQEAEEVPRTVNLSPREGSFADKNSKNDKSKPRTCCNPAAAA